MTAETAASLLRQLRKAPNVPSGDHHHQHHHQHGSSGKCEDGVDYHLRPSLLDHNHLDDDEQRKQSSSSLSINGFINLFWVSTAIYSTLHLIQSWRRDGGGGGSFNPFGMLVIGYAKFWPHFVLADLALIGSTFIAVPLSRLQSLMGSRDRKDSKFQHIIAILIPSVLPITAIYLVKRQDWPGIQAGTLVAHAYVLAMKMHSYLMVNYYIKFGDKQHQEILGQHCTTCSMTFANFAHFLLVPSLIYRPRFPRSGRIRWLYMVDRTAGIIAIAAILSLIVEHTIYPILKDLHTRSVDPLDAVMHMVLPFTIGYILIFFLVFEYILNWFAELSRFGDRQFYSDWWNSRSLDEFARKWNLPVHQFLHHHVYCPLLATISSITNSSSVSGGGGRDTTLLPMALTFLLSAILHEIGMGVISRRNDGSSFHGTFFLIQMGQLPLIWFSLWTRMPKRYPRLSNLLFWFGMLLGLPIIAVLYAMHS